MEGLHDTGSTEERIAALQAELVPGSFTDKESALLRLAEDRTLDPAGAGEATRRAVAAGWEPDEIASAIFLVSYFNMVTRIADAFDLPPDESHPYDPEGALPMLRCAEGRR